LIVLVLMFDYRWVGLTISHQIIESMKGKVSVIASSEYAPPLRFPHYLVLKRTLKGSFLLFNIRLFHHHCSGIIVGDKINRRIKVCFVLFVVYNESPSPPVLRLLTYFSLILIYESKVMSTGFESTTILVYFL
jgi:hypothetical protein